MGNQNYYWIEPINAYIKTCQVKHDDDINCELLNCEVIGLVFYQNQAATFLIKLDDGEIFRYIPLDAVYWKEDYENNYTLDELIYLNNPSDNVKISYIKTLGGDSTAYIFQKGEWISSEYVLSIDYWQDDRMLNLMKLGNGQFALLPFHKLKFKNINDIERVFARFKKQELKFIVKDN